MNVWSDVRFDHAAATAAVDACEAAATSVDAVLDALADRHADVADFSGQRREEFDTEHARIVRELAAVVQDARAVAAAIASGAETATAEQQRRERRRDELREEALDTAPHGPTAV